MKIKCDFVSETERTVQNRSGTYLNRIYIVLKLMKNAKDQSIVGVNKLLDKITTD